MIETLREVAVFDKTGNIVKSHSIHRNQIVGLLGELQKESCWLSCIFIQILELTVYWLVVVCFTDLSSVISPVVGWM